MKTTERKNRAGGFLVICGPSGVGKSTLIQKVLKKYTESLRVPVSYTTRPPRAGEVCGRDYHFVSSSRFKELRQKNFFLEWACVYQHYYGTAFGELSRIWKSKKIVIKDLDTQGADEVKKKIPTCLRIFILPPSLDALTDRVQKRREGSVQDILKRSVAVNAEIAKAKEFDHQVVNHNLTHTLKQLGNIIEAYIKKPHSHSFID